MPAPLEICLEDLDRSPEDERYLRCVALPGGEPGLALDRDGAIRWMPARGAAAHGLWISADDQLVLQRDAAAGPVTVERGGRSLAAPAGNPVVLLHGDQLWINGRRLQVHVHGVAHEVRAPEPLGARALARIARAAAAALALGATVAAGGPASAQPGDAAPAAAPIEVRARPPAPKPRPTRPVDCKVTKVAAAKDKHWPVSIHATCPAKEKLTVGHWGQLLDAKGQHIGATAQIKRVNGSKIVAAAPTKPETRPSTIRFRLLLARPEPGL